MGQLYEQKTDQYEPQKENANIGQNWWKKDQRKPNYLAINILR